MGFWNALSVLAPVAPAMSDAQDIRTQRTQDAAKFASDQAAEQAQLIVHKMAAQAEQQRITQGNQPKFIKPPQWNPLVGSDQGVTQDPNTGLFALVNTPGGVDPVKVAQKTIAEREEVTGQKLSPEEKQNIYDQIQGLKPIASRFTQLTGAAGQPQQGPDGQFYVRGKDANGNIVAMPMGPDYKPPPPKTPSNDTRFIAITGRPQSTWTPEESEFVNGYKNMIDVKTTQPGVARMNALANSRIVTPVDPNDPSAEIYATAGQAMKQGLNAPGSIDYRLQMPTGAERGRADLAMSAREQISDMEGILRNRSDLFGPLSGKVTNVTQWLGSQDPDAQRFAAAARVTADHLAGVFGGRSQAALKAIYDLVGKNTTNPAAAIAGLEQLDKAAARIQSRGTAPGASSSPTGTVTLKSGGKTYNIPRAQVAEFRKDHPDATQ